MSGLTACRERGAVGLISIAEWKPIGNEIHVWSAALEREENIISQLESTLSLEEKARADRFHFARDRNRFVVARALLRELLGGYLHHAPEGLEFSYGQHGKPELSGAYGSSGLSFNLSHSSGLVVYAIANGRNLGIDVEHTRANSAGDGIAERYFSASEVSDLQSLPPEARVDGFFRCWTRKEAYLKATGMGLHIPLDSFAVSLAPGKPAEFLSGVDHRWHLAAFDPGEGYLAALAYDGAPCGITCFSVDSPLK
ncbi:MAG TPA: 4'-phosphopantetheinyl transferase superfamily protein [Candidatus Acidoferrales bacterium]